MINEQNLTSLKARAESGVFLSDATDLCRFAFELSAC